MAQHGNETVAPPVGGETFWEALIDFASRGTALLQFFAIVLGAYFLGRGLRWIYTRSQRGRPTSAQFLVAKTITLLLVFAGIWIGIRFVFDVDPASMFATLGIVSLALGFGLQNTVANLAAGVSLSLDKPFDVGDRIKVGQTWGDVINIGFRSTAIRTTAGELVVIPNAILDTQEVWNYNSRDHTELRIEVPVQISYASSIALAEDLALRVAREAPSVQAYPEPRVMVRALAADGIDMEVRCWLADSNEKARAVDFILRGLKQNFDAAGVHIPFPQRTMTYLKEEVPPAPTPEHLQGQNIRKPVIVALVRSPLSSPQTPANLAAFAKGVDCRLVFLHVRSESSSLQLGQGQQVLNKCLDAAKRAGVSATGRMEVGGLTETVANSIRQEGAKLLVLIRGARGSGMGWMRSDQLDLQKAAAVPVQLLEHDTPPGEKGIRHWKESFHGPVESDGAAPDPTAISSP